MELLRKYFPELSASKLDQYEILKEALTEWNQKINVISRKDMEHFSERHLLHSLAIAKFIQFRPQTRIADIGTGGGFPGLPLAIFFPECEFFLVDSIGKKIMVVNEMLTATGLTNVVATQERAENIKGSFDFVVSRAVTAFPKFYGWTKGMVSKESKNEIKNGIIYLKGGDLSQELGGFGKRIKYTPISTWFDERWFDEKGIVYLGMKG